MPALTFGVSTNFALANFLASRSFGNVLVALTRFRFPRGSSNETYHVPLDLLAMIPSRGLRRRLTDRGRDLNRGLTKSFRLPPASPENSFSAVAGVRAAFRARTLQRCSWSPWRAIGYSSLFNFRFPQRVSLRDGSNVRSTFRFSALNIPMRACISGPRSSAAIKRASVAAVKTDQMMPRNQPDSGAYSANDQCASSLQMRRGLRPQRTYCRGARNQQL